jgi:hypothetical protein
MSRTSMRSTRLLSWRYLRWAIAIPTLPLAWWACTSHPLTQPTPNPEQQTDIYITVAPVRQLDMVFMVDNSPSMAPKVEKMNANFPRLIEALKDPSDGTLPDLRVAIIDSDLGTGGAYTSGPCGPNSSNGGSNYGDMGKFQMRGDCGQDGGATYLEYHGGQAVNYKGQINDVFACLAKGVGTNGCGEEHQLQAFEWALVAGGIGNDEQHAMLRPQAYLGLVILSDEDDCSAATNDGMFGDKDSLRDESASLRCATRGHACGGRNLTDSPPGYPTDAKFETNFSECSARTDACPNGTDGNQNDYTDTSVPTSCSPLKSVHRLAEEIKSLKSNPDEQILVAGIFGWPLTEADMANAKYKIDQIPNPNTADTTHPMVYDYWPVCYDPNHPAPKDGSYNADAVGWGAQGGLRMASFVDEFGENGLKFSICQPNFSDSMKVIGDTIAKHLQNLCVDYKLYDKDANPDNGLQPDCRVQYRRPQPDSKDPSKIVYVEDSNSLPECPAGSTNGNVSEDCWQLSIDKKKCEVNGQLIQVLRTAADIAKGPLDPGTKVGMQCRTCTDFADMCNDPTSQVCKACSY